MSCSAARRRQLAGVALRGITIFARVTRSYSSHWSLDSGHANASTLNPSE